jgi:hypothetical protein
MSVRVCNATGDASADTRTPRGISVQRGVAHAATDLAKVDRARAQEGAPATADRRCAGRVLPAGGVRSA